MILFFYLFVGPPAILIAVLYGYGIGRLPKFLGFILVILGIILIGNLPSLFGLGKRNNDSEIFGLIWLAMGVSAWIGWLLGKPAKIKEEVVPKD